MRSLLCAILFASLVVSAHAQTNDTENRWDASCQASVIAALSTLPQPMLYDALDNWYEISLTPSMPECQLTTDKMPPPKPWCSVDQQGRKSCAIIPLVTVGNVFCYAYDPNLDRENGPVTQRSPRAPVAGWRCVAPPVSPSTPTPKG